MNKGTIAPGNIPKQILDTNEFLIAVRHLHEDLLHDATGQLEVNLSGKLQSCVGCSMGKGYRKAIVSTTTPRATRKLKRNFIGLSGKTAVLGIEGVKHILIVRDDLTRFIWIYFPKNKSEAPEKFEEFLPDARDHEKVEIFCSTAFNVGAEHALDHVEKTATAAHIPAPLMYQKLLA